MNLVKTTFITVISNVVRSASLFIVLKALALKLGPSGYANVGHTINLITLFTFISGTGLTNGMIKHISDESIGPEIHKSILRVSLWYATLSGLILALLVLVFAPNISRHIYKDMSFINLIKFTSFICILITIKNLLQSVITAKKEVTTLAVVNILGSLLSSTLVLISINKIKPEFLLFIFGSSQAIAVIPTFIYAKKYIDWSFKYEKWELVSPYIKSLMGYLMLEIVSSVLGPATVISIRNLIILNYSQVDAGLWDGMTRIGSIYYTIITTSFFVHVLPNLSSTKDLDKLRKYLFRTFSVISTVGFILAILIIFFKKITTVLVLSSEFSPINNYYTIQMISEFFRLHIWLGSMLLLSKSCYKEILYLAIIANVANYFIVKICMTVFGYQGLYWGTLINNMMYACMIYFVARRLLKKDVLSCV